MGLRMSAISGRIVTVVIDISYYSAESALNRTVNRCMISCDIPVFTARCTLVQSAVLRSHVVCLSVCLSVCNVGEL